MSAPSTSPPIIHALSASANPTAIDSAIGHTIDPTLVAAFERAYPAHWPPHPAPTDDSIARISDHFALDLPAPLLALAHASPHFSSLFLSLGPNDRDPLHIIRYNRHWRRRRRTRKLPETHVIISNGFMDEDFWCLVRAPDRTSRSVAGLQYWSPAAIGYPRSALFGEIFADFPSFLARISAPTG